MPYAKHEFFFLRDHKMQDEELHESIIAGGDQVKARKVADKVAKRLGLTDEEIEALNPKE